MTGIKAGSTVPFRRLPARGDVDTHNLQLARALRTRAMRRAAEVDGIESLINCLLVHGEDDPAEPLLDATDQLA